MLIPVPRACIVEFVEDVVVVAGRGALLEEVDHVDNGLRIPLLVFFGDAGSLQSPLPFKRKSLHPPHQYAIDASRFVPKRHFHLPCIRRCHCRSRHA